MTARSLFWNMMRSYKVDKAPELQKEKHFVNDIIRSMSIATDQWNSDDLIRICNGNVFVRLNLDGPLSMLDSVLHCWILQFNDQALRLVLPVYLHLMTWIQITQKYSTLSLTMCGWRSYTSWLWRSMTVHGKGGKYVQEGGQACWKNSNHVRRRGRTLKNLIIQLTHSC